MSGIKLWKGKKTKDFHFQDRISKEFIYRSGTACYVHKYIGPYEQSSKDSSLSVPTDLDTNELSLQDVLLGENRDRKYAEDIIELSGAYTVSDNDFDLTQFGYLLSGDSIVLEFHTNDTIEKLGRKLMTGDVIELPHLRDDTSLDQDAGEIKKYYVVQDSNRSAIGYGPTWFSHIWRTRCTPIVDTQEYRAILHNETILSQDDISWLTDFAATDGSDSGVNNDFEGENVQSTLDADLRHIEKTKEHQRSEVEKRSFEVGHIYVKNSDSKLQNDFVNYIVHGDGIPANFSGEVIYSGDTFPDSPQEGDYFVRSDYEPERLFKRVGSCWKKVHDIWRTEWSPAHRILNSFINNNNITVIGDREDEVFAEKQALSEVVLPKAKGTTKIVPKDLPKKDK
jgi:hypothetical protein